MEYDDLMSALAAPDPEETVLANGSEPIAAPAEPEEESQAIVPAKNKLKPLKRPAKVVLSSMAKLHLDPSKWNAVTIQAVQEFGRFMTMEITGKILMVRNFSALDQTEKAMEILGKIAGNQDYNPGDRALAAANVAKAADAMRQLSGQIFALSKEVCERVPEEKPTMNLPPALPPLALQVNVNNGPQPEHAISGTPALPPLPPE